jgi:hypothetical protein
MFGKEKRYMFSRHLTSPSTCQIHLPPLFKICLSFLFSSLNHFSASRRNDLCLLTLSSKSPHLSRFVGFLGLPLPVRHLAYQASAMLKDQEARRKYSQHGALVGVRISHVCVRCVMRVCVELVVANLPLSICWSGSCS